MFSLRSVVLLNAYFFLPAFGQTLKIGAIFHTKNSLEERIFKFAVRSMNQELHGYNISLVPSVRHTNVMSAFNNINQAYQLISDGVIAIIGPRTSTAVKAMHSVCSKFHIAQLSPSATDPDFMYFMHRYKFLLRMSPSDTLMSFAISDLLGHFKWERMGILTSRTDHGMNSLMDFREIATRKGWKILGTEHFLVPRDLSQVNATQELLNLREKGARVILLNCMEEFVPRVLEQAGKLNLIKDWVWILTDGAIAKEGGAHSYMEGLVGLRLPATGSGELFNKVSEQWMGTGETERINARAGRTYDAVLTVAHALKRMIADNISITEPAHGSRLCRAKPVARPWNLGSTFLAYLKMVRTEGIMSYIRFRRSGSPSETVYDVVNYQADEGWVKVGEWNDDKYPPLNMERKRPIVWLDGEMDVPKLASLDLRYARLKVLVALSRPFVMKKSNASSNTQELPYEGFCIDLLNKLHEKLQFVYDVQLKDKFGEKQAEGTWDGIIGQLSRGKADLGVSTFNISPEKKKAVDFTQPYFSVSFKIVMRKTDHDRKANIWGFLDPFEKTLWIAIIISSLVVGTVVWFYDRLSPYGYHGRVVQSPQVDQDDVRDRQTLRLHNSFWSAVASYLEQGAEEFYPVSYSGRAIILTWWFAIAIFGATYTANLAAFLTINKNDQPIKRVEDLANQNRIAYGTAPGSLADMLKSSSLPAFQKLWRYISSHGTLEANDTYGFEKVRRTENYAFLWESAAIDYEVQLRPCNTLKVIGRPFGSINYGFVLPRNSPYTHNFSVAMLDLQQEGFMERMMEKWFRSRSECAAETEAAAKVEEEGGRQLHFSEMAGVFIALAMGVAAGVVLLLLELVYASYKDTKENDSQSSLSLTQALCKRLVKSCRDKKSLCAKFASNSLDDPNNELQVLNSDGKN